MEKGNRKSALFYPFFFILRRIMFVVSAIWLNNFVWSQIAIQFLCSTTSVIYLLHAYPFDEYKFTYLEVGNEVTSVFLLYCLLCFTDWVPLAETRYTMGWVFIFVIGANLAVHVIALCKNKVLLAMDKRKRLAQSRKQKRLEELNPPKVNKWLKPKLKVIYEENSESDEDYPIMRRPPVSKFSVNLYAERMKINNPIMEEIKEVKAEQLKSPK